VKGVIQAEGKNGESESRAQRPSSAISTVIIRNLPGARASVGRTRTAQQHNSEQSCSNLFVVAPVVARLNLNGQMSLLTRTERSVSFPMSLPLLNNSRHRTTSAIVSMHLLAGGRKKRTFIGTIVILNHHKKSARKRSVKSRKQRQRHSPSRCMSRSLFILPPGHSFTHTHSGFGPSKKESSSSTQGTGTNAIPITPSTPAGGHVSPDAAVKAAENAERRQRRKERKEEKAARRAEKAARDEKQRRVHNDRSRHDNYPPRSLTPVRQQRDSRSPSPKRHRSHDIANRDVPEDDGYRRRSREYHNPDHGRFHDRRSSRSRSPPRRDSRRHSELPPRRPTKDRQGWNHNATSQWAVGTQTSKRLT
jgi:hypothetical protein